VCGSLNSALLSIYMVEFVVSFDWVVIGVISLASILLMPKIIEKMRVTSSRSQQKLSKWDSEYISELEADNKSLRNKWNNAQRGPKVEGDMSELDEILPELFGSFEQYAPKWLKPFLGNKDTQKWLINYATEHPEKVQGFIGKMVKKKISKSGISETQTDSLTL